MGENVSAAIHLPARADPFFVPSCFSRNKDLEWMGYSVRSQRWRFTQWLECNKSALCPIAPHSSTPVELYDHIDDTSAFDPDAAEFQNVADLPQHVEVIEHLRAELAH